MMMTAISSVVQLVTVQDARRTRRTWNFRCARPTRMRRRSWLDLALDSGTSCKKCYTSSTWTRRLRWLVRFARPAYGTDSPHCASTIAQVVRLALPQQLIEITFTAVLPD